MTQFLTHATALFISCTVPQLASSQSVGFDPRTRCGDILANTQTSHRTMIAAWTFGFLAANTSDIRSVDDANNAVLLDNIARACATDPDKSLIALVAPDQPEPEPEQSLTPGSEAEVRSRLAAFMQPDADLRSLTQALFPTDADIRAVYAEPLATALINAYRDQMTSDAAFGPKRHQDALLVYYATTRELVDRKPILREFPGGYRDVLQYFIADVPIVLFKFVKDGELSGYAFDGLIHVNGRWVLMPKPWRALPE